MALIKVRPARPDLLVRNPDRDFRPLPPEGEEVPDNFVWRKRLADGDVVIVEQVQAQAAGAAEKSPKKK